MQTESTYRVHCHFCDGIISSDSPSILDDIYPICALCELTALMNDGDFAWKHDEAPIITRNDEEWNA